MALPREPAGGDIAALVIGKPKGGRPMGPPRGGMSDAEDMKDGGADEASELPPGFESAASEAFPDMDPSAYPALKRLIATCMENPDGY